MPVGRNEIRGLVGGRNLLAGYIVRRGHDRKGKCGKSGAVDGVTEEPFLPPTLDVRLTPLYSKIYYKEENYLKVKTAVFKYITPPYSKD